MIRPSYESRETNKLENNIINHIAFVLDGSGSMSQHVANVIKVADSEIEHLAKKSKEMDQETRVTIYTFEGRGAIKCLVYDKDVLRVPSIKGLYRAVGDTPLIDATIKAIEDLEKTATLYGDHSFLQYVITDGQENASVNKGPALTKKLNGMPENWTVAAFVPDSRAKSQAESFGFHTGNIQIWNATSAAGYETVASTIRATTDSYFLGRTKGIRGYSNLFAPDVSNLTQSRVQNALQGLHFGQYRLLTVPREIRIDQFVEGQLGRPYRLGEAYYELQVPVKIQPQKEIVLLEKGTAKLFKGSEARTLLGLPNYEVKVGPTYNRNYDIFVQSTSVNRKLLTGQRVVVLS